MRSWRRPAVGPLLSHYGRYFRPYPSGWVWVDGRSIEPLWIGPAGPGMLPPGPAIGSYHLIGRRASWGIPERKKMDSKRQQWFPIRVDMIEAAEFRALSPCAGVLLLDIGYRLHAHLGYIGFGYPRKPFAHFDAVWARRLRMSVVAFRKARGKLAHLGWIVHTPGHQNRGGAKPTPTMYHDACFARVIPGQLCAPFPRSLWQVLIIHLQREYLEHVDLVVVAVLAYFWRIGGGVSLGRVSVPKALFTATGITIKSLRAVTTRLHLVMPYMLQLSISHRSVEFIANFGPESKAASDT